ncbi:MAG: hypothetical protein ACNA8W_08040 [Bradymonadaceae bacterium]
MIRVFAIAAFGLLGCSTQAAPPHMEALDISGTLELAVGPELTTLELGPAHCDLQTYRGQEMLFIRVMAPRRAVFDDGTIVHPHVLTARLPADLGEQKVEFSTAAPALYQATASHHDASYAGYDYPLLQIIAENIDGTSPTFSCTASKAGEQVEIICNEARVVPWRAGGEAPTGSFRGRFGCSTSY